MKIKNVAFGILLTALAISCSDDSSSDNPAPAPTPEPEPLPLQDVCPESTTVVSDEPKICLLQGVYTQDLTLTADTTWVLSNGVFVGEDNANSAVLTIEPGTKIIGQSGADFLVINRGSKIMAAGTAEAPIVFTSAKEPGSRSRGDWGGLIINGNAPINGCDTGVCVAEGEGNTGVYGGDNPEDNSGMLKYVRIEFAGNEISPDNELNGIAFQGIGSGTVVDYIQVHYNADDGVEFFGGTVNAKHIVLTGNRDDSLDWVNGWNGTAQYILVDQADDQANNGIEGDNLKQNMDIAPRSNPTLVNMTFVGTQGEAAKGGHGILLRRGTSAKIYNSVIANFKNACIKIDDAATFASDIQIYNTVLANCKEGATIAEEGDGFVTSDWFSAFAGNSIENALTTVDRLYSSQITDGQELPANDFIEKTSYRGAIESAEKDWTAGWTTSAAN
ncbi:MAG: hypothetical protein HRU19_01145 [Pseudobacteriovorax sp.]|nr:hypothetical protein [Pseudobacteriovorax sp.]